MRLPHTTHNTHAVYHRFIVRVGRSIHTNKGRMVTHPANCSRVSTNRHYFVVRYDVCLYTREPVTTAVTWMAKTGNTFADALDAPPSILRLILLDVHGTHGRVGAEAAAVKCFRDVKRSVV